MRRAQRAIGVFSCGAALLLSAATATAQEQAQGFALDRFEPSERGSDWFVLESWDLRGHARPALGLVVGYANKPLMLYSPTDGEEVGSIVEHQLVAHFGGSIVLWDRVRFGLNLPLAAYQAGDEANATFAADNKTTFGDLRLSADAGILGTYGDPFRLAGGFQFFVPTGSQDSFTSDGAVRLNTRVGVAGEVDALVYASMLGFGLRANGDDYAEGARGSEIAFSAAAGVRIAEARLIVGPELFTNTVVSNGDGFFARLTTPVEMLLGAHFQILPNLRVNTGAGTGLTRAFGTPRYRMLGSIEWFEPIEKPAPLRGDRDKDGVFDDEDACPDVPGIRTSDPKTNGCPDRDQDKIFDFVDACPDVPGVASDDPKKHGCPLPNDTDGDGIIDPEDACPTEPGPKSDDPKKNGCPDRDKDGILDSVDACPDEPGVASDDPKKNGCPLPKDTDGDGILDPVDACPKDPGPANEDPKKHGCPVARVEKGQIIIREQVQFAYNSSQILKASDFILEAVQKIFNDNPEIKKVSVEGHTDSKGGDAFNKRLSGQRAQAVVKWLVQHGIDASRLEAKGWGEERPIDTNDTDAGRANNRRVEFHILEQAPSAP
jgi:outer membrane protein OmpA-like peptidoglycan-associated protein